MHSLLSVHNVHNDNTQVHKYSRESRLVKVSELLVMAEHTQGLTDSLCSLQTDYLSYVMSLNSFHLNSVVPLIIDTLPDMLKSMFTLYCLFSSCVVCVVKHGILFQVIQK